MEGVFLAIEMLGARMGWRVQLANSCLQWELLSQLELLTLSHHSLQE